MIIVLSAICVTLGVLFAAMWPSIDRGDWKGLPVPGHFMQLNPDPVVTINWGLYIGAIGALTAIGAAVVSWFHACTICRHVEEVRYRMLRAPITEIDEFGKPFTGKGGQVYPAARMPAYGYSKPGMEVDF